MTNPTHAPSATSSDHPYAAAVTAGGLVFVSGALSVDADCRPVAGRRPALDAALSNVIDRLGTQGGGLEDLVRLTYYVTDITLRDEANQQYRDELTGPNPARSFVQVASLPYGATVEIEAIARATGESNV